MNIISASTSTILSGTKIALAGAAFGYCTNLLKNYIDSSGLRFLTDIVNPYTAITMSTMVPSLINVFEQADPYVNKVDLSVGVALSVSLAAREAITYGISSLASGNTMDYTPKFTSSITILAKYLTRGVCNTSFNKDHDPGPLKALGSFACDFFGDAANNVLSDTLSNSTLSLEYALYKAAATASTMFFAHTFVLHKYSGITKSYYHNVFSTSSKLLYKPELIKDIMQKDLYTLLSKLSTSTDSPMLIINEGSNILGYVEDSFKLAPSLTTSKKPTEGNTSSHCNNYDAIEGTILHSNIETGDGNLLHSKEFQSELLNLSMGNGKCLTLDGYLGYHTESDIYYKIFEAASQGKLEPYDAFNELYIQNDDINITQAH